MSVNSITLDENIFRCMPKPNFCESLNWNSDQFDKYFYRLSTNIQNYIIWLRSFIAMQKKFLIESPNCKVFPFTKVFTHFCMNYVKVFSPSTLIINVTTKGEEIFPLESTRPPPHYKMSLVAFHYDFISGHILIINNLIYVLSFPGDKKRVCR